MAAWWTVLVMTPKNEWQETGEIFYTAELLTGLQGLAAVYNHKHSPIAQALI